MKEEESMREKEREHERERKYDKEVMQGCNLVERSGCMTSW